LNNEIILDTRELEAPEPMNVVINRLKLLSEERYIKMIHRIEPKMLYTHLLKNDLNYKVDIKDNVVILVWNNSFRYKTLFELL